MEPLFISNTKEELIITENHRSQVIAYQDIISIVYDSPYVTIHMHKENRLLLISLIKFSKNLPEQFIQCNRSTVVNSIHIEYYSKKEGFLRLKNGKTHLVSVRRRNSVERFLYLAGKKKN